jgi:hypothetical protein
MGSGQASRDWLTRSPGEDHSTAVDSEIAMPRPARPKLIARGRKKGCREALSGGNGIQLKMIAMQTGFAFGNNAVWPPHVLVEAVRREPHHGVAPHRICVQVIPDKCQIMDIKTSG